MKRIILGVMVILSTLIFTSCTINSTNNFMVQYNKNSDLCIVTNMSEYDYEKLKLTLEIYNEGGYKLDAKKEISELKQGEKYEFKLSDLVGDTSEVQQIQITQYSFEEGIRLYLAILDVIMLVAYIAYLVLRQFFL